MLRADIRLKFTPTKILVLELLRDQLYIATIALNGADIQDGVAYIDAQGSWAQEYKDLAGGIWCGAEDPRNTL